MKIAKIKLIVASLFLAAIAHADDPTPGVPLNDDQRTELIQVINKDAMVHGALQNEIQYGETCTFALNKAVDQGGEQGWYFEAQFICSVAATPTQVGGPMFLLEMSGVYLSKVLIDVTYEVDRNHN